MEALRQDMEAMLHSAHASLWRATLSGYNIVETRYWEGKVAGLRPLSATGQCNY